MKEIILDTSFILSCIEKKIDFFEKLFEEGFKIIIPEQAIKELTGLNAKLELKIIEKNSQKFKVVKIPGKDADSAIIKSCKENPTLVVATLDKGLAKKIPNKKMIIRGKKLEII